MSRALVLILSFIGMMGVCTLAETTTKPDIMYTLVNKPTINQIEQLDTKSLLIASEMVLRYQLRHQYTVNCGKVKYAVIDYVRHDSYIDIILVSGQKIVVDAGCLIFVGEPTNSTYISQPP